MSRHTSTRSGSASRSKKAAGSRRAASPIGTRAKVVWVSFLFAMTGTGGLLLALDGRPAPRTDGLSLSALASVGGASVSESISRTRAPLDTAKWQAIVVHHSGSPVGSAATIASEHEARGFKGLGHHFVIGNGAGMPDGELHVGFRWRDQLAGAHAAGPDGEWLNHHAISICMVGDGNRREFTPVQLQRLQTLVAALRQELNIPAERVYLHSDVAPTSDPGRMFPQGEFRAGLRQN
jgi:hypothetical protein